MNDRGELNQFGTFDVENYGDLLYPVLLEKMLHQRGVADEVRKLSFMGGKSVQRAGYWSSPIRELFSMEGGAAATLIVGGGDLLRTDWNTMASHYATSSRRHQRSFFPLNWRRTANRLLRGRGHAEKLFRDRYMNYPAAGPFIIDPGSCPGIGLLAYCSCGVPFKFREEERRRVALAIDKSVFVYVRDLPSEQKLRQAGVKRELHVAPDLAVMLGEFFDAAKERAEGRRILETKGVDVRREVLCVQSNPQPSQASSALLSQLRAYQAETHCEVILLPLGLCHGDDIFLKSLARASQGALHYIELNSIFDSMSVIAASDVFLGTSLHGNITAFSFGVPHLIGPIAVEKCDGFLDIVNLPPELKLNSWAEAGQRLNFVTSLGSEFFAAKARAARQRVGEVFDALLQAVAGAGEM